ncbi:MAG: class I SAM-dependent methyltransferase [Acidobacteriota bacterium]|nr:class I SAM-dependent methyltransferase [Acidobacteriota bacterium]
MGSKKKEKKKKAAAIHDRHLLYTASVQSVDADIEFFERVYKSKNRKRFTDLREDFCGTAVLACEWVRQKATHRAWGVDLDRPTLDWARKHYLPVLGEAVDRLHLMEADVLKGEAPKVDVIAALNFSYCIFKTREQLRAYFAAARRGLRSDGVLILDVFGGTEALIEDKEDRKITSCRSFDGRKIPAFTYGWEQASFNPIDHEIRCHIHFKLPDGKKIKRAFTYDWRLWMLPEMRELLDEAGFRSSDVYLEGWDDEADDTDGIFRKRKRFENQDGWVAYLVAHP